MTLCITCQSTCGGIYEVQVATKFMVGAWNEVIVRPLCDRHAASRLNEMFSPSGVYDSVEEAELEALKRAL